MAPEFKDLITIISLIINAYFGYKVSITQLNLESKQVKRESNTTSEVYKQAFEAAQKSFDTVISELKNQIEGMRIDYQKKEESLNLQITGLNQKVFILEKSDSRKTAIIKELTMKLQRYENVLDMTKETNLIIKKEVERRRPKTSS